MASLTFVTALAFACGPAPSPHAPAKGDGHDRARAIASCEGCHAQIFEEWRSSNHAEAFRHETFQTAYAIEPMAFCVSCHAPHTDAERPTRPGTDLGVSCASCHSFATDSRTPASAKDTCAGCHEFPFPGSERLLQKTVSEHARSRIRAHCTDCHMSKVVGPGGPHVDHRFSASRNEALVRSAATIAATRERGVLVLTFTRAAVGHAFPTGDVFRRLRIFLTTEGKTRDVVLGRETKERAELDRRPFVDGRDVTVVRVPLSGAEESAKIAWRVDYERVGHPTETSGTGAALDGAIEVARGEL